MISVVRRAWRIGRSWGIFRRGKSEKWRVKRGAERPRSSSIRVTSLWCNGIIEGVGGVWPRRASSRKDI